MDGLHMAEHALQLMQEAGFEHAQVGVSRQRRSELCVAHNAVSLLRSSHRHQLQLVGLLDGRRAASEGSALDEDSLRAAVQALWTDVQAAPQDAAHAVSTGQKALVRRGTLEPDVPALADAMDDLLAWRRDHAPTLMLEEALAGHNALHSCVLTSAGSRLQAELGWFDASVFGLAREDGRSSSFNFAEGCCDSLDGPPLLQRFGFEPLLLALTRQLRPQALGGPFAGSVVLTPRAVADLLDWLLQQLGDLALIDGSSVYGQRVGQAVASPLLSLRSRFEAPGVAPFSADAHALRPVQPLDQGRLVCLLPSLYGSRKTVLPAVASVQRGWELAAGGTPLARMISEVPRGALVDRLSMGRPAANGDFSGLIKNSFAITDGELGPALAETMIAGNVAQMLLDVTAVSAERIDTGTTLLPWLVVQGLHFS